MGRGRDMSAVRGGAEEREEGFESMEGGVRFRWDDSEE
jgi:hypothetical protein